MDGIGRACGKVILLGEHAVVYGSPALAVAIEQGAQAVVSHLPAGPSRLRVGDWELDVEATDGEPDFARAFRAILDASPSRSGNVLVEASTDLPPASGLGCSAALGVAIARALDPLASDAEAIERAMGWENVFHGSASGVDAAVSARGGCVLFEKRRGIEPIVIRGTLTLCIGHSGVASGTRSMVEAVAKLRARRPELTARVFEAIGSLVQNARLALEAGDKMALGRLMDLNQMLLGGLFVSTPEIEQMCELARSTGAHGAKLTGAGGGGSVVALAQNAQAADGILEAWRKAGFPGFASRVVTPIRLHAAATDTAP